MSITFNCNNCNANPNCKNCVTYFCAAHQAPEAPAPAEPPKAPEENKPEPPAPDNNGKTSSPIIMALRSMLLHPVFIKSCVFVYLLSVCSKYTDWGSFLIPDNIYARVLISVFLSLTTHYINQNYYSGKA